MRILYMHPWLNIIGIIIVTLFFTLQLPRTTMDNDVLNFIPENHPEAKAYERTGDLFGSRMILGVGIDFLNKTIFTAENVRLIQRLTGEFEQLEHVESVMSFSNIEYIEGSAEGMLVYPLIDNTYRGTKEDTTRLKQQLTDWDIYSNVLYSTDFTATQILISFEDGLEAKAREDLYYKIDKVMGSIKNIPLRYYLAGNPAVTVLVTKNMIADLRTLIPLVVLVVLAALFISFRRLEGVIISMLTVVFSTVWAVGAMAFLRVPLSMVATVIPVLMIAVGSAYGIHIISRYYDELRECCSGIDQESHREIIYRTMRKTGRPVFLAGLTTIAGFGALSTSRVIPMRNFGIFTAFGVLSAVITALLFIPSILLVRKHNLKKNMNPAGAIKVLPEHKTVTAIYHFFNSRKIRIMLLSMVIAVIGTIGASRVIRDNAVIEYFKVRTDIRKADSFIRENFSGTEFFDIVVRGQDSGALANPEILMRMDDLSQYLEQEFDQVARVHSFTDLIKRMNQVMNYPPEPTSHIQSLVFPSSSGSDSTWTMAPGISPAANDAGLPSFYSPPDNIPNFDDTFEDYSEGFEDGFSVQEDTSQNQEYSSQFGGGAYEVEETGDIPTGGMAAADRPQENAHAWDQYLQPVDFSQQVNYGDFITVLNTAYADKKNAELTAGEFIKLLNKQMNYRGSAFYEVPYDPAKYPVEEKSELKNLISQYLLLFSGSLNEWSDDALEPRQVRMNVQLTTTGSRDTRPVIHAVHEYADRYFPAGYTVETTGSALVKNALTDLLIDAQTRSILISLSLVFLIVSINFHSLTAGLFGIIPMGFAILINFAVMGYFGIKLDISTAMVASVAIGIGIDYTIHFMSNYHYERLRTDDIETVSINTLRTTGKAIIFNAIAVASGFLVLMFSQFNPLMYLGMLIALTMLTSSIGAMTLLPVLLNIFKPGFISKNFRVARTGG